MEALMQQQENTGDLITKFVTNTQKAGKQNITKGYLQGRQALLERYWAKFEVAHASIVTDPKNSEATDYFRDDLYSEIEAAYTLALGWILDSLAELVVAAPPPQPPAAGNQPDVGAQLAVNQRAKLPAITLPHFAGDYNLWPSFHDRFVSLVVDNPALSNVEKLHHLKASLSGKAELVLRQFAVEANNFEPAWELLKRRYANKRMLVNALFSKLLSQQKIGKPSPDAIRLILDTSTESIASLKAQLVVEERFDALVIFILVQKLHVKTIEAWEQSMVNNEGFPTLAQFTSFLERHTQTQDLIQGAIDPGESSTTGKNKSEQLHFKSHHVAQSMVSCTYCTRANHTIFKCYQFKRLTVPERINVVRSKGWCTRCLSSQHKIAECSQTYACIKCNGPHTVLLHQSPDSAATSSTNNNRNDSRAPTNSSGRITQQPQQPDTVVHAHHALDIQESKTILATAQILVTSSNGKVFKFRALIDPGSQASLITRAAASLLNLPTTKCNSIIKGVGGATETSSNHMVNFIVNSIHDPSVLLAVKSIVLNRLTDYLPSSYLPELPWPHLQNIPLADPKYYKPDKIDLLLGGDLYYDLFIPEIRKGPPGVPVAQNTALGWIIVGKLNSPSTASSAALRVQHEIVSCASEVAINDQLKKFWEIEEIFDERKPTKDDEYCQTHFAATHLRKPDGRYIVDLPFNTHENTPPHFGNSRKQAFMRLCMLERRLNLKPELKAQYTEFIDEYRRLGHMQLVQNPSSSSAFYLPHHAIVKPSSSSTKLRVVFDASAKDSNGTSLNATLRIGPTIQQDLLSILLRWRKHKIAITADAEKMYRQIEINPEHRRFQRILWRNSNNAVEEYELSTVTYGTASAPYLAIRTIHQLAQDEQHTYPNASVRTINDMYVDDFISGGDNVADTQELQHEMSQLFSAGGFNLRKWSSNSQQILDNIPATNRESITSLDICRDDVVKTLGVFWNTVEDEFHFVVKLTEQPAKLTKRALLSDVSKLFDPFGFLAPVVITAKIMFQSLWLKGVDWDDTLPDDIVQEWLALRANLGDVTSIKIPRWLGMSKQSSVEFHGFCDASIKAYAAVIYCRTLSGDNYSVQLITSKTRVAPIKRLSLPNLELSGASLLAKLMNKVRSAMNIDAEIFAWTDSTIVLDWIHSNTHKQTFVANRISTILDHLQPSQWHHVRSKHNPADVASRGISPTQLKEHALWWHGPTWLQRPSDEWPVTTSTKERTAPMPELIVATVTNDDDLSSIINKFSNLDHLVRIIAHCCMFAQKCRAKSTATNPTSILAANNLREALRILIKHVQYCTYSGEINKLKSSSSLSSSKLSSLYPFIDNDGVLRVGGRLRNANINPDHMHPILMPREHHLTKLIMSKMHLDTLHGGMKLTLATLRQKYWVPNARTSIRSIIHRCVKCNRYNTQCKQQLMSTLPMARVTKSKVFSHTGVDYAGPFNLRLSTHRGRGTYKGFVAVFVCLATKAIHLEVASDLSSKTFIAAFKRFVARRGQCTDMYSDNGTNFVGAHRELMTSFDEAMAELSSIVSQKLANTGITWHFIPANSPHFGGLWEAAVKSFKFHLKRIVSDSVLTYEEFYTLLTQIEGTLNSRPLCQLSSDPNDLNALTPGHFLVGCPLNATPEPTLLNINENRLNRWQLLEKMNQDFWRSWSRDYLSELQQRPKRWTTIRENLQENDIVLIKDDRLPPSKWMLARVLQTHPGDDGMVRVVTVKHQHGIIKRAVNKICKLPIERQ